MYRIPTELGRLKDLRLLDMHDNLLTGGLREKVFSLSKLAHLDLSSNFLKEK